MKAPKRHRPLTRRLLGPLIEYNLDELSQRVAYVGSPEHKDTKSFAGVPRPRGDATICDRSFLNRLPELQEWLRKAVRCGAIGTPWEGDFPRYAWYKDGDTVYEARLVNRTKGEYKGWALSPDEWPRGIDAIYE
ncbi:MAG TPA: hypothetical protein VFJ58_15345 [Armatimonadota bacterium]|nr:hypothetical protein [Armatimonadota bacterium]